MFARVPRLRLDALAYGNVPEGGLIREVAVAVRALNVRVLRASRYQVVPLLELLLARLLTRLRRLRAVPEVHALLPGVGAPLLVAEPGGRLRVLPRVVLDGLPEGLLGLQLLIGFRVFPQNAPLTRGSRQRLVRVPRLLGAGVPGRAPERRLPVVPGVPQLGRGLRLVNDIFTFRYVSLRGHYKR